MGKTQLNSFKPLLDEFGDLSGKSYLGKEKCNKLSQLTQVNSSCNAAAREFSVNS
jgi:hypothetical protein